MGHQIPWLGLVEVWLTLGGQGAARPGVRQRGAGRFTCATANPATAERSVTDSACASAGVTDIVDHISPTTTTNTGHPAHRPHDRHRTAPQPESRSSAGHPSTIGESVPRSSSVGC